MPQYLTFGDLVINERFISLPIDGDNLGHGGFLKAHYIFVKVRKENNVENARRECDSILSQIPDSMTVIKVE